MIEGLTEQHRKKKRLFDLFFSLIGFLILFLPVVFLIVLASMSTKLFGIYSQERIGLYGQVFTMYKVRTMTKGDDIGGVTLSNDPRITKFGSFLRDYKLDEIPQLWNVIIGDMSIVGPRPDVRGYADKLKGEDKVILSVRPGITGPATLKYKNEEEILSSQRDPIAYNDKVIWKDKIEINKKYIKNWSLKGDLIYILRTLFY